MPSVPLSIRDPESTSTKLSQNPLPTLLQTPSGLAILEIQGTIHAPFPEQSEENDAPVEIKKTSIGRLEFPLYNSQADAEDTKWMKRVYLYVGRHQRLTGEVKKLPKPLLVLSKRTPHLPDGEDQTMVDGIENSTDELEILEVIRHKILFGGRPEPVGD